MAESFLNCHVEGLFPICLGRQAFVCSSNGGGELMNQSSRLISVMISCATALFCLALAEPLWAQNSSMPLFGPEKFVRMAGSSETASRTFAACNTGASYRLVVENGIGGESRISSATVSLNGVEVVRPSDLSQKTKRIEKEVTLRGENTLSVRLASNPGGFLTISLFCASGCLDVAITSPNPDSTENRNKMLVQGSLVNASGETGVVQTATGAGGETVELAQVQGSLFAGLVPLQPGENTLAVTASDACGYRVRKDVVVHTDGAQETVRLNAWPGSGVLPAAAAAFEVTLEAETSLPSPASRYAWDFDGDGAAEQTGSDLTKTVARYQTSGLYLPTVTVTDAQGSLYRDTAVVLVLSQEEMDVLLQGKWEGMRNALVNGDIDAALGYIEGGAGEQVQAGFREAAGQIFRDIRRR
jgi:hypothetical protein